MNIILVKKIKTMSPNATLLHLHFIFAHKLTLNKNIMNKNLVALSLILLTSLLFTNCEKDDPEIPNEEELITSLSYQLSPIGGGDIITLSFQDLDGDGGDSPLITGGTLSANQSYVGSLDLMNEAGETPINILLEVVEEAEEHQVFFESNLSTVNITYGDEDANNFPLGVMTTLTTGAPDSGTLTIILRHEPNKSAAGVSEGDITNAGGETDIQVTFPIDVQ